MMLKLCGSFGCTISLDFRKQFGESIELECFQFLIAPLSFVWFGMAGHCKNGKRRTQKYMTYSMDLVWNSGRAMVIPS